MNPHMDRTLLVSALLVVVIEVPLVSRALWTGQLPRVDVQRAAEPSGGMA